jgi:hypothetical protein
MTATQGFWLFPIRALTVLITLACGSAAAGSDPEAMHLMVQICLPDKKAFFDELNVDVSDIPANISYADFGQLFKAAKSGGKEFRNAYQSASGAPQYEAVRMWRASAGDLSGSYINIGRTATGSETMGSGALVDATETNQPVFDDFIGLERPADVIAISVTLPRPRGGHTDFITYWFKPSKDVSPGDYTPWLPAFSEEGPNEKSPGRSTFWMLMNGMTAPTYPVGDNAPRVRYTLTNHETRLPMEQRMLRVLRTVQLQRAIGGLPIGRGAFHLAPPKGARIPSC